MKPKMFVFSLIALLFVQTIIYLVACYVGNEYASVLADRFGPMLTKLYWAGNMLYNILVSVDAAFTGKFDDWDFFG